LKKGAITGAKERFRQKTEKKAILALIAASVFALFDAKIAMINLQKFALFFRETGKIPDLPGFQAGGYGEPPLKSA